MFPGRIAYFAVVGNVLAAFLFVSLLLVWWLIVFDSCVADPPFSFTKPVVILQRTLFLD